MAEGIRFEDVSLQLAEADGLGRSLLRKVSFSAPAGTVTALLGRSGSGKTTLLRMAARLAAPTSGRVLLEGRDVASQQEIALRRRIGYVIQETGLFPHFTVERNAAVALEIAGQPREQRRARARELLSLVGLDAAGIAGRYPQQLSGGQRQRVGLARALAADPALLLMDEPFGALDPVTRVDMQRVLRRLLQASPRTVLLVTHDLEEALYLADRIVLLEAGELVADLTPEQLLAAQIPFVRQYVGAFRRDAIAERRQQK